MLGWIVFFGLMTLVGIIMAATASPARAAASHVTGLVFSVLLVASLLVRAIRGRALIFWDLNQGDAVTLNYSLQFNSGPSVDPIIDNGGHD